MRNGISVLCAVLIGMMLGACSTGGTGADLPENSTAGSDSSSNPRFSLNVWDDSAAFDADPGRVELVQSEEDGLINLDVLLSNSQGLRALYFDVEYDPQHFHVVDAASEHLLADASGLLELNVTDLPGRVYHGEVLVHPQSVEGFSGSGVAARLSFAPGPATQLRESSSTPATDNSRAVASYDGNSQLLNWGYASQGDYDQNSETNIADLTPLGVHFHEQGPFGYFSVQSVVDGDGNGEINIADITPIGVNFGARVSEYRLYLSESLDAYPAANDAPSKIASLASVDYADFSGTRFNERLHVQSTVSGSGPAFLWVRPSDGVSEGTPSTAIPVSLGAAGNIAPVAKLNVPVTSGVVPFAVNFDASTSSDPDGGGGGLNFMWDLDGDGGFELDSGSTPQAAYVYEEPGIYIARLKVRDELGTSSVVSVAITANVAGNQLPTAQIISDTGNGELPLTVGFDASGSSDPDGSIVSYMWDFNGDGLFDMDSGSTAAVQYTYTQAGSFDARVKVTDDDGGSALASLSGSGGQAIEVGSAGGGGNLAPEALFSASLLSGTAPLSIEFDAGASSDPDGTIVRFEWDFNGDGIFDHDSGSNPLVNFQFTISGLFNTVLRVTDNGGLSDTVSLSELGLGLIDISGGGINIPPIAAFGVNIAIGTAPLMIQLNAGASNDPDGIIVKFEWDCDGDGIFEIDNGAQPLLAHLFELAGDFNVSLRVTDDDGATDVVSINDLLGGLISINAPPIVSFQVDTLLGLVPLLVNFDASASIDPDGTIELFEWDYDGDGVFDKSGGLLGLVDHLYIALGVYDPVLRCTDNDGAVAEVKLSDLQEDLIEVSIL